MEIINPRFFIVSCIETFTDGSVGHSVCEIVSNNGRFFNKKWLISQIMEADKQLHKVDISNIVELSEQDYNDYIA